MMPVKGRRRGAAGRQAPAGHVVLEYFTALWDCLPLAVGVLVIFHFMFGSPRIESPALQAYSAFEAKDLSPMFTNQKKSYIINGEVAKKGRFTYPVLLAEKGRGKCGGSLIAPDMVLTAAHCVFYTRGGPCNTNDHTVTIGTRNIVYKEKTAETINVVGCTIHPAYDNTRVLNDFAILQLDRDSKYTPVWLNDGAAPVKAGDDMTVMGWGLLSEKSYVMSPQLMELDLKYLSTAKCGLYFQGLEKCHLCIAPAKREYKSPYFGDSGGPVVVRSQGTPGAQDIQVGVVSFGLGSLKDNAGYPSVHARVSDAHDWIKETAPGVRFASVTDKKVSGSSFPLRLVLEAILLAIGIAFGYFIDHQK